jgi:branched-chain amino acid transport system permease protein
LLEKIAIAVLLAISLGMVVGFLGELSLGHAGFMCIGAYAGGKIASVLTPMLGASDSNLLILVIALLVGGAASALFGLIIGLPALRLRGDYLAIVTLAFGEIVRVLIMKMPESWFGGATGLTTPRFDSKTFFIIAFLMVLLCLLFTQNLIRSKHGRAILSIRDNEIAARATGINVTKYKLLVFISSSFFAGIAGVLFSYSSNRIQYDVFDYNYSIEILVMVVLGGMGNINGSMIAAALITFLNTKLQTTLTGSMAVLQNLIYALILIVIVIYNNAPALKPFREKHNLRVYLSKLKKKKPTSVDAKEER